ncbi:MAG TPA: glutamate racemase [Candidatus Pacearchaeota archaeon]|nr:glutamate racemase [Candidatus Pacearchaeota archaeon]
MIGLFDSGLGGLTVVKEVWQQLPGYPVIYLGDTARLPYGTKPAELIRSWSRLNVDWLFNQGAEIVIIACHTASAWAFDLINQNSRRPVFGVITPGVRQALATTQNGRIGVIGTPGTIRSGIYQKKIKELDQSVQPYFQSCPLFVPIIEENWMERPGVREIAEEYLKPLVNQGIDTLILGCTHYPLMRGTIEQIVGQEVTIVDPAQAVVQEVKNFLIKNQELAQKIKRSREHRFCFSSQPYQAETISRLCLGQTIKTEVINDN